MNFQVRKSFVAFAMWSVFAALPASATQIDGNLVQVASEWKSKAEHWAHELKKDFKRTSPEYRKAAKLYIDAKAAADGWVNQMLMDLRNNVTAPSQQYQKKLQEISERAAAFVEYSEHLYIESKGPSSLFGKILKDFSEAGVAIFETYHKVDMERKNNIEKSIQALTWKAFEEA